MSISNRKSTDRAAWPPEVTEGPDYTHRLVRLEGARWKRILDVQAPYRWNLHRLALGRTLDLGCGIGRNLATLSPASVGVDHNPTSVSVCRERGLTAYTPDEFTATATGMFDTILAAHVLEHMPEAEALSIVESYLARLCPDGRIVIITPQERGFASDASHVRFVGFAEAAALCVTLGFAVRRQYSFPLPRLAGKVFAYNEFVTDAHRAGPA